MRKVFTIEASDLDKEDGAALVYAKDSTHFPLEPMALLTWDEHTDQQEEIARLRAELADRDRVIEAAKAKCRQIIAYHNPIDVFPFGGDEAGERAAATAILRALDGRLDKEVGDE